MQLYAQYSGPEAVQSLCTGQRTYDNRRLRPIPFLDRLTWARMEYTRVTQLRSFGGSLFLQIEGSTATQSSDSTMGREKPMLVV